MRLSAFALFFAVIASPVLAQQGQFLQQYQWARHTFYGKLPVQKYLAEMPGQLLDGLSGRWFTIEHFNPERDDKAQFQEFCRRFAVTIEVTSEFGFSLKHHAPRFPLVQYSSRGGNLFNAYVDPVANLAKFGTDPKADKLGGVALFLRRANGPVTVFRPSPDIFVLQEEARRPVIYGRCTS